jgi:hypothetical protein
MALVEDNSTSVRYSAGWQTALDPSASGGTTHFASAYGASAKLDFTGRSVAWVAPVGGLRGKARIYIDGVAAARVDLGAGTAQPRRIVFARNWTAVGAHSIRIKVLGTLGRPRVDLDGLVVLN